MHFCGYPVRSTFPLTLSFVLLLAAPSQAACPGFAAAAGYEAGVSPLAIATGDFDGDGHLDLAVVNEPADSVAIMLGAGNGTFANAGDGWWAATARSPHAIVAADLDGDGDTDLAVASHVAGQVSVLLGDSSGTFAPPVHYAAGPGARSVAVADFNGDGRLDLAVANQSSNDVTILLGTGGGNFAPHGSVAAGNAPFWVATGQLDGIGAIDLAVANAGSGTVSILAGDGSGGFTPATELAVGAGPGSVAVADLNRDGRDDVVSANQGPGTLSVWFQGPGSTWTAAPSALTAGAGARTVVVRDFDGDGRPDLAVANYAADSVSVFYGAGSGSFLNAATFATGAYPLSMTAGDFDEDGFADLATADGTGNTASVLRAVACPPVISNVTPALGPSAGGTVVTISGRGLTPHTSISFGTEAATAVSCPSFTTCTATAPAGAGMVAVRAATGSGTSFDTPLDDFAYRTQWPAACTTFSSSTRAPSGKTVPVAIVSADWNGDGLPDLAVGNIWTNDLSVFLGSASGFGDPSSYTTGYSPEALLTGDWTGDGKLDLVVRRDSKWITVLPGLGNGAFASPVNSASGVSADGFGDNSVAMADFDGDGKLDLALPDTVASKVLVLRGNGDGSFASAVGYTAGAAPVEVLAGDWNADGSVDLAVASDDAHKVSLLNGNGDGTFAAGAEYSFTPRPLSLVSGDFDGDGALDIAVGTYWSGLAVLRGHGDGTFSQLGPWGTSGYPLSMVSVDLTGDGVLDVAFEDRLNLIKIFRGEGNGTFTEITGLPGGHGEQLVAVDWNRDGRVDLANPNQSTSNVDIQTNSTDPGELQLSSAVYTVSESAGTATVTVSRSGGTSCQVTVHYATSEGSALDGSDYVQTSGTLTIASGAASASFTVPIVDNTSTEPLESFTVTISEPGGGSRLGARQSANVDINDDDVPGVTVSRSSVTVFESGTTATFTVRLDTTPEAAVAVDLLATDTGEAAVSPAQLTFTNMDPQTVTVTGVDDAVKDGDQASSIRLTVNTTATLDTGYLAVDPPDVTVTTKDDEIPPSISFVTPSTGPRTGGTVVTIVGRPFIPGSTTVAFGDTPALDVQCASSTRCTATAPPGTGTTEVRITTPAGTSADTPLDDFTWTAGPAQRCSTFSASTAALPAAPWAVVRGDWNEDGKDDLAFALDSGVAIRIGNGDGTFGGTTVVGVYATLALTSGDWNGDGHLDLAGALYGEGQVSILIGNGGGGFTELTPLSTQTWLARAVTSADFDADGRLDLATVGWEEPSLEVYRGQGNGTFVLSHFEMVFPFWSNATVSVVPGDWNSDGRVDLAIGSDWGTIAIRLGNGDGTFATAPDLQSWNSFYSLAPGDWNGDGKADLASGGSAVLAFAGNGDGTFATPVSYGTGWGETSLAVADLNSDGQSDLAFTRMDTSSASLLLGAAGGTFTTAGSATVGSGPRQIVAGDWNGDGRIDLATANRTGNSFTVLRNVTATGTLGLASDSLSVSESAGSITFTVERSGGSDCTASVGYSVIGVTAAAGSDFTSTSGTLDFAQGATSATFAVSLTDDALAEVSETLTVLLSAPDGAALGRSTTTVTILDDEPPAADLAITKTVSAHQCAIGEHVAFHIRVLNEGPSTATGVEVTDILPDGMGFVSALPSQGTCEGTTTVLCHLGTLANGEEASIELMVRIDRMGDFVNTASVDSDVSDPHAADGAGSASISASATATTDIPAGSFWMLALLTAALVALGATRLRG